MWVPFIHLHVFNTLEFDHLYVWYPNVRLAIFVISTFKIFNCLALTSVSNTRAYRITLITIDVVVIILVFVDMYLAIVDIVYKRKLTLLIIELIYLSCVNLFVSIYPKIFIF